MKKRLLLMLFASVLVLAACGNGEEETGKEEAVKQDEVKKEKPVEDSESETKREGEGLSESTAKKLAQTDAMTKAEAYLELSGFSKPALIEELEFDGFSNEEATEAVSQLKVDWQEQAVIVAESYLEFSDYADDELIEQLLLEGFSNEEATYAASEVGL